MLDVTPSTAPTITTLFNFYSIIVPNNNKYIGLSPFGGTIKQYVLALARAFFLYLFLRKQTIR